MKTMIKNITLLIIIVIIWIQIKLVEKDSPNPQSILFTELSERDPATWPIQILIENETGLKKHSVFNTTNSPVTAIVNRIDDSDDGVIHVVRQLLKYPFIKEILVYNQVTWRPLYAQSFLSQQQDVHIEIIPVDASLLNMGKFTACAMASYSTCYFQDDLWINTYMDSLYAHASRHPNHFVVNTRAASYKEFSAYRFQNTSILMKTGYADLRYGAFVSRNKVQTFLSQASAEALDRTKFAFADVYFSIWLNQYPYLIAAPLLASEKEEEVFEGVDAVNNREVIEYVIYDALFILESRLKNTSWLIEDDHYFETNALAMFDEDRDVRSVCSNDECLFITNIKNSMSSDVLEFNSEMLTNISTYHRRMTVLDSHSYDKAVDQNRDTCWKPIQYPRKYDYFELDILVPKIVDRLEMHTSLNIELKDIFKVTVRYGSFWKECQLLDFKLRCDSNEPIRSIRVTFNQDINQPFELCGIAAITGVL